MYKCIKCVKVHESMNASQHKGFPDSSVLKIQLKIEVLHACMISFKAYVCTSLVTCDVSMTQWPTLVSNPDIPVGE